ncbi:hypothetical protein MTR67_010900 [Solanum verrucosum]|uniref:Heme peroxidase n=1 Tax=Solanum verrucosum TaxID=315347 RepID=A0AAF0TLF5_SOLVR|nr:hypothetical protein MTR67_010900 [Solanum verrucosum]
MVHFVDKLNFWHRLPVFLGLAYLGARRRLHQQYNLINVGTTPTGNPGDYPYRTADGKYNDPFNENAGSEFSFFGRNMLPVHQLNNMKLDAPKELSCKDGSAIYGNNADDLKKVRTFIDGKLKLSENGLIQQDENGKIISGDVRNTWAGLLTLYALFVQEHNAVCDALKKEYPELKDEDLYRHARLVTSAVIAKVHTIDWTVELLKTDTLLAGMRISWYGLLGKKFKDTFGHIRGDFWLSGFVGMKKPRNHGVPYSLTEEFSSVYRMHQLLPDTLQLRNIDATPAPNKSLPLTNEIPMEDLIGGKGAEKLSKIGFINQMVSMGHQACGALELWNYSVWMRDLVAQDVDGTDRPDHVDLAALEKELDLLVGIMAEKKIKGFAISETAFFIFLFMAGRRLEGDRFFTSNYNEETYTKKGLEWVNTTESLKDVLDRHYPKMTQKWMNSSSAFSVWDSSPQPYNPIPLYLRLPQQ